MKNKLLSLLIAILILTSPFFAFGSVKINEIAWMGNSKSSYCEWVELYNDADSEVDLKDSKIFEKNTSGLDVIILNLTKKIDAKGYYLIERTTNSCPDPVEGLGDDIGSFGGSGLGNSGEYLTLKSPDGTILDFVDASKGWSAGGSANSNLTMQKNDLDSWITATATPRLKNYSVVDSVPIVLIDSSSTSTTATSTQDNNSEIIDENSDVISAEYSAHSSGEDVSKVMAKTKAFLSAGRDRLVLAGTPVEYSAKLLDISGNKIEGDNYQWSLGDGTYYSGPQIFHNYDLTGDYVVILNSSFEGREYVSRANTKVVNPDFKVEKINKEGEYLIKITNRLKIEANLKDWQIKSGFRFFNFKADTIILPGGDLTFGNKITGIELNFGDSVELVAPGGRIVSKFTPEIAKTVDKSVDKLLITGGGDGDKGVEKIVDKPVDNSGDKLIETELIRLKEKLIILQNSLVANSATVNVGEKTVTETYIMDDVGETLVKVKEPSVLVEATSSNRVIMKIEAKNKESGIWRFFKSLFIW